MTTVDFFQAFIDEVFGLFNNILYLLNRHEIGIGGVTLLFILLGAIALRMIVNIFWKGEKG